jgi:four helix bundle protein
MNLNDFEVYRMAMDFGEDVYNLVMTFNHFNKNTVGIQLVTSSDSVAANISEGFGRYYYKDKMRFYFYARGSLFESQTWIEKSFKRQMFDEKTFIELINQIKKIGIKLNNTISQLKLKSENTE